MSSKNKEDPSPKSKKSSVNSGLKLPNDMLYEIANKANAKTKAALKASSKLLNREITTSPYPKIISYKTGRSNSLTALRKIVEKYKDKKDINEGDLLEDPNQYRAEGTYFFVVNKKGEKDLTGPEIHRNGDASVPAWVLEKGVQNGHSLGELLQVYSEGRFRYAFVPEANIPKKIKTKMKKGDTYVYSFKHNDFGIVDKDNIDL